MKLLEAINTRFPQFPISFDERFKLYRIQYSKNVCQHFTDREVGEKEEEFLKSLESEYKRFVASKALAERYTHLIFQISSDNTKLCVWANRGGQSGESFLYNVNLNEHLKNPEQLKKFNEIARACNGGTQFYCSCCHEAKLKAELEAVIYASYFCKKCAIEDKEVGDEIAKSKRPGYFD